jgi:hypothetical protein
MDLTAKATSMTHTGNGGKSSSSASNKGKQNEGEKHVVFCVSVKYAIQLILLDWHIKTPMK